MPQMSPLMWSYLFILFSSMLILSMVKLYFSTNKKMCLKPSNTKVILKKLNWKW